MAKCGKTNEPSGHTAVLWPIDKLFTTAREWNAKK